MRHADLGVRIFLFGNLFRRPPAGASPSLPPCRLVERLETEAPSEPAACPAPALESRVWAACAGHLLWARSARYGMRSAFVSRQRSEHLATCPQKKMGEIEKLKSDKKEARSERSFKTVLGPVLKSLIADFARGGRQECRRAG